MAKDNEPKDSVVDLDNTQKPEEVDTNGTGEIDPLDDLFGTPPATEGADKKKPDEKTPTDDGTSDDASKTGKPAKVTPKKEEIPDGEAFYKVGSRTFKTKEDLDKFVNSQTGYNSFLTGAFKKLHPDFFNEDGSLDHTKLNKIEKETAKVSDAAATVKELQDKAPEDMTEDEKKDLAKAQEILRPVLKSMGVAFKDDPDFQKVHEVATRTDASDAEEARTIVETFVAEHPLVDEHRVALGKFMKANEIEDIGKAWEGYKALNEITEEAKPLQTKVVDKKVNHSADKNIPVVIKKNAGTPPAPATESEPDFFDSLISAKGMK